MLTSKTHAVRERRHTAGATPLKAATNQSNHQEPTHGNVIERALHYLHHFYIIESVGSILATAVVAGTGWGIPVPLHAAPAHPVSAAGAGAERKPDYLIVVGPYDREDTNQESLLRKAFSGFAARGVSAVTVAVAAAHAPEGEGCPCCAHRQKQSADHRCACCQPTADTVELADSERIEQVIEAWKLTTCSKKCVARVVDFPLAIGAVISQLESDKGHPRVLVVGLSQSSRFEPSRGQKNAAKRLQGCPVAVVTAEDFKTDQNLARVKAFAGFKVFKESRYEAAIEAVAGSTRLHLGQPWTSLGWGLLVVAVSVSAVLASQRWNERRGNTEGKQL